MEQTAKLRRVMKVPPLSRTDSEGGHNDKSGRATQRNALTARANYTGAAALLPSTTTGQGLIAASCWASASLGAKSNTASRGACDRSTSSGTRHSASTDQSIVAA